jgi:acetyl esterase
MFFSGLCGPAQHAHSSDLIPPNHADVRYGPHDRNVLDLYLADSPRATPLVLFIHGGGFMGGDKRDVSPSQLRSFLSAGFSVSALNYRLTSTAPAPAAYSDCGLAVQFLRFNAKKWNIDANRIAATGSSAGAGISMWLAFHDDLADPKSGHPIARQSTRLTCIAVSDGQSSYDPRFAEKIGVPRPNFDRHPFFLPFYGLKQSEIDTPKAYKLYEEMAPITYLSKDDPPALLDYNFRNEAVDSKSELRLVVHHPLYGVALKERMDRLGIACIVQHLDRGGRKVRHGEDGPPLSAVQFIQRQFELTPVAK